MSDQLSYSSSNPPPTTQQQTALPTPRNRPFRAAGGGKFHPFSTVEEDEPRRLANLERTKLGRQQTRLPGPFPPNQQKYPASSSTESPSSSFGQHLSSPPTTIIPYSKLSSSQYSALARDSSKLIVQRQHEKEGTKPPFSPLWDARIAAVEAWDQERKRRKEKQERKQERLVVETVL